MISVGIAAGFALAANAFIVPSTMSLKPDGFANSMQQLTQPASRLVKLDCPGCSVPKEGVQIDGDNSLLLNFTLANNQKTLLLNDIRIYPRLPLLIQRLSQVSTDTSLEAIEQNPIELVSLSRAVTMQHQTVVYPATDDTADELIDMTLSTFTIESEPIKVDSVNIRIFHAEDGTLGIGDIIQLTPARNKPNDEQLFEIKPIDKITPIDAKPSGCPAGMPHVLCVFREMMVDRLERLRQKAQHGAAMLTKPCHGMFKRPGLKGGVDKFIAQQQQQKDRLLQHQPNHHHHHPHHHHMHLFLHRMAMGLQRIFFGFIVPIMIGIAAGMTASLLGMVVGTVIAWVWIRFVRKGKKGNASERVRLVEQEEEEEEEVPEEKRRLMSDVDASEGECEMPAPFYVEKE